MLHTQSSEFNYATNFITFLERNYALKSPEKNQFNFV